MTFLAGDRVARKSNPDKLLGTVALVKEPVTFVDVVVPSGATYSYPETEIVPYESSLEVI